MENTLPRQVKSYINDNLNSTKVNVIDLIKDNFTQALNIREIQDEMIITEPCQYQKIKI